MCDVKEIREWIQLIFIVVGGTISLIAYFQNVSQRRLDNALKVIALFKESLQDGDLDAWKELFHTSSEPAGAMHGYYVDGNSQIPIGNYFSEGSHGGDAISRMADGLEVICYEMCRKSVDARYVWFELGQLLQTMHSWLSAIDHLNGKLLDEFPNIKKAFQKYHSVFNKWPKRIYTYVE